VSLTYSSLVRSRGSGWSPTRPPPSRTRHRLARAAGVTSGRFLRLGKITSISTPRRAGFRRSRSASPSRTPPRTAPRSAPGAERAGQRRPPIARIDVAAAGEPGGAVGDEDLVAVPDVDRAPARWKQRRIECPDRNPRRAQGMHRHANRESNGKVIDQHPDRDDPGPGPGQRADKIPTDAFAAEGVRGRPDRALCAADRHQHPWAGTRSPLKRLKRGAASE